MCEPKDHKSHRKFYVFCYFEETPVIAAISGLCCSCISVVVASCIIVVNLRISFYNCFMGLILLKLLAQSLQLAEFTCHSKFSFPLISSSLHSVKFYYAQ